MHSILAIASMTLKDALRKRVMFTILFFLVFMVSVVFLPVVRTEDRIRQLTTLCFGGIGFFGMIVAIFLSAPNLPDDIKSKTIFTVLTKPARRWQILAGKIMGLAYVLAFMLFVMGFSTFIYLNIWSHRLGGNPSGGSWLAVDKRNYAKVVERGGLKLELTDKMTESEVPVASGLDEITFHFEGLSDQKLGDESILIMLRLFAHNETYDPDSGEGTGGMQVRNPTTGESVTMAFGAETLQDVVLSVPRALVDNEGRVSVRLFKRLESGSYSAMASSVAVISRPSSYFFNFVKALCLMFIRYMVLVFIATAASTFLTSTVSNITALFIYFTGSLTELVRDQALKLGTELNIAHMGAHTHGDSTEQWTFMSSMLNFLLRYFYLGISVSFPNLSALDPVGAISEGSYIEVSRMLNCFTYGAVFAAVAFVFGWVVFSYKEVAK